MLMGFATLNDDPHERAIKAKLMGDEAGYARGMARFVSLSVLYAPVQADVRAHASNAEVIRQMELYLKERWKQLIHRGQGSSARRPPPWPTWREFASAHKLAYVLVSWWVCVPPTAVLKAPGVGKGCLVLQPGTPGLMFFRNEALTKFLQFALGQENLTPAEVKKVRQRLKLIPVGDRRHLVWDVSVKRRNDGNWDMKLDARTNQHGPRYLRRPTKLFRQVTAALSRCGFKKVGAGQWKKTTSNARWRLKTCSDPADTDFFWIVVSKR
jgi:hypothetical protein